MAVELLLKDVESDPREQGYAFARTGDFRFAHQPRSVSTRAAIEAAAPSKVRIDPARIDAVFRVTAVYDDRR